jgi:hypothetical protein
MIPTHQPYSLFKCLGIHVLRMYIFDVNNEKNMGVAEVNLGDI